MQQGKEASFTLSGTALRLIPLLCNGSSRIGLVAFLRSPFQLGGPFDFCAFASLSELLLGSLVIALKCTRPRQRFMYDVGRYSMTENGMCQEGKIIFRMGRRNHGKNYLSQIGL